MSWAGFEVQVASNAGEAIEAAARHCPHLILLDIGMPDVSGYTLCRSLREMPDCRDSRIYAVSGFSGPLHEARCEQAGFDAAFTKPLDLELLPELR